MNFSLGVLPIIVILVVIVCVMIFISFYCYPGYKIWKNLRASKKSIQSLDKKLINNKHALEDLFINHRIKDIWRKYAETLHAQYSIQEGQRTLICLRATVPAESFFNSEVLVDTQLHTDFFKHLPGILTGIGIIGTFLGLITGLEHFNVDTDANKLQNNLALLLSAVREAFIASGVAITAAILVTFTEKIILNSCYYYLDELVQEIDTLYEAGAGEEYLSQLVDSASESATQTRLLKDALVTDLKELLTNFSSELAGAIEIHTKSQTSALIESNEIEQARFRESVVEAMKNSLDLPMQTIVEATKTLGGNQGEAIDDLFTALISKIDDTFGGQMRGLNEMMSRNTELMDGMQHRFSDFLTQLEKSGQNSQTAQTEHLQEMMNNAEERQQRMNEKVNQALLQISETVSKLLESLIEQKNSIGEAGQQGLDSIRIGLSSILEELKNTANQTSSIFNDELLKVFSASEQRQDILSNQVRSVIEQIEKNQESHGSQLQIQIKQSLTEIADIAEKMDLRRNIQEEVRNSSEEARLQKLDNEMLNHFNSISESVFGLTQTIEAIRDGINKSISHLERVTVDGAVSLKSSANAMLETANAFDKAGKHVSDVLIETNSSQEKLISASQILEHASTSLEKGILDYQEYRKHVGAMIHTLKGLIQETENKTNLNRDLVLDMTNTVQQSRQLSVEANTSSEKRQLDLNNQVLAVIEQIQQNQETLGNQLQVKLTQSLEQITEITEKMDQRRNIQEEARIALDDQRVKKLDSEMVSHLENISESVLGLTQTIGTISDGINKSITHLERVTVDGANSLKTSADAMLGTANVLDSAGKQVSQALEQTSNSQEKLISASHSLGQASQSLEKGMLDYQEYRKQVEAMIITLKELLQETENKSAVNKDLVVDMTNMVQQSRQLQIEANQFITQSGEVLKIGFDSFADAVTTNMDKSRAVFDKGLGQAVDMISGQIQELEAVLDQLIRAANKK